MPDRAPVTISGSNRLAGLPDADRGWPARTGSIEMGIAEMEKTRPNLVAAANGSPHRSARLPAAIGGYFLLRQLGEGGMGSVYLAYKEGEPGVVALKVLNADLVRTPGYVDRFYREARSGARLDHPNIVRSQLAGHDATARCHFLVLEYVDGPSVQELLQQQGRLALADAVSIVLGVARALEHAHSRRIIHRDIKPDNILLTPDGLPKLADLGLAKQLDDSSRLTGCWQGFGTTAYIPYEQASNARLADGRSDIYALGATFYQLVTGVLPFQAASDLEVIDLKKAGLFPPARALNAELPPAVDAILARMLARQPDDRYQSAAALIADLERAGLVPNESGLVEGRPAGGCVLGETQGPASAEPTRLRLQGADEEPWDLRYRSRSGQICVSRATTAQIINRVRVGRMPAGAEARRSGQQTFQPLNAFPEFRSLLTHSPAARLGPVRHRGLTPGWALLLVAAGVLLAGLAGAAALAYCPSVLSFLH